jgi:hypothetical protein
MTTPASLRGATLLFEEGNSPLFFFILLLKASFE